jgi:IS5 family transposase
MSIEEQLSLAATGFEGHSKTTRRTKFLIEMDRIVPWKPLRKIVSPFYYKGEGVGRNDCTLPEGPPVP